MPDDLPEKHLQSLVSLLPPGPAWDGFRDADGRGRRLLRIRAGALADVSAAVLRWQSEYLPWTAAETLAYREAEAGLPDPCAPAAASVAERQDRIRAVWTATGGQSRDYFRRLAASIGIEIRIVEYARRTHGLRRHGEPYGDDDWNFVWEVVGPLQGYRHRAHGTARLGEPYASWAENTLRCPFERARHPHRHLIYRFIEE